MFCVVCPYTEDNRTDEAPHIVNPPVIKALPDLLTSINLTCGVSGSPQPEIQWFKDNVPIEGERLPYLYIEYVRISDRAFYHCEATNVISNDTSRPVVVNIRGIYIYDVILYRPFD